jgi:hypothetical protein
MYAIKLQIFALLFTFKASPQHNQSFDGPNEHCTSSGTSRPSSPVNFTQFGANCTLVRSGEIAGAQSTKRKEEKFDLEGATNRQRPFQSLHRRQTMFLMIPHTENAIYRFL